MSNVITSRLECITEGPKLSRLFLARAEPLLTLSALTLSLLVAQKGDAVATAAAELAHAKQVGSLPGLF